MRVGFHWTVEHEAAQAERVKEVPPLRGRLVTVGRQVYVAWDAHRLLEETSEPGVVRPGHPCG